MLTLTSGNLLEADAEALVNTVNCVGVMGKGVALQFKQAFPANFRAYAKACKAGEVVPGRMLTVPTGAIHNPKYIVNFPTKRHWKGKSSIEDIRTGLTALRTEIIQLGIRSIALPPLGCGNGGLDWNEVRPLIESAVAGLSDVDIRLYVPAGAPASDAMPVRTKRPRLTAARALLVALMGRYASPGYRLSMLELQKLAYVLHRVGALPTLKFREGQYGPYANDLHHMLQALEGHYIRGLGDRDSRAEVVPLPEGLERIAAFLERHPEARDQLEQASALIEGYETPYSMELLASVDWVAQANPVAGLDADVAVELIASWSPRKRKMFSEEHIGIAWRWLKDHGMFRNAGPGPRPLPTAS